MQIKSYEQFNKDLEAGTLHGFYNGVSNAEYHNSPGISKSGLDMVSRSPAHYKFSPPRKATSAMNIGTAIHCAILEPEVFEKSYMMLDDVDDKRTSEYKEAVKRFGKDYVLTSTEATNVKGMQEAIYANGWAAASLNCMEYTELSAYATDANGVLLKCRFDAINSDGEAIDLKKTRDASASEFSKSIYNYRYHVQEAFYRYVYKLITGDLLVSFLFLAVEEDAPHFSKLYHLDFDASEIGLSLMTKDIKTYTKCIKEDYWPLPDGSLESISVPNWVISQYETALEEEII